MAELHTESSVAGTSSWAGPEQLVVFRLAQLLLIFDVAEELSVPVKTVDRLGYFDFLSANPFVTLDNTEQSHKDRTALQMVGFNPSQISYGSVGHRFASRRRMLQSDLSLLVSRQLVQINDKGYAISPLGHAASLQLDSVYADAIRTAARIVLKRVGRLSDKRLTEEAERWLGKSWLLLDFLDDVHETVPTKDKSEQWR